MKDKAQSNIDLATRLLNDEDDYSANASIHCSYYAVVQYMKHTLASDPLRPISLRDQDANAGGVGSHNYLITETATRLSQDVTCQLAFRRRVRNLKQLRVVADYKSTVLGQRKGKRCLEEAKSLIKQFEDYLEAS
ncbi:hypothetical protein [Porphyromonas bennonis]|uniref:hypothetical protein n=1 Tax=Porphyromonas bennonis TaxID=501496 RepID=UPI000381791C|nr:hypothetical protein [Porphyromonas bennonis]